MLIRISKRRRLLPFVDMQVYKQRSLSVGEFLCITLGFVSQVLPVARTEYDRKTICEIHAEEKERENTVVLMCNFSQNVAMTKRQFEVKRLSLSSSKEQDILLACLWIEDKLKCYTNPKCSFDGNVTSQLKVKIHNVTEEDDGRYGCYIVPSKGDMFQPCTLTPRKRLSGTSVYPTGFQGNSDENWKTTQSTGDLQNNQEDFSARLNVTIPHVPIVITIVVAIIPVAIILVWCRIRILIFFRKAEIRHTEDNQHNEEKLIDYRVPCASGKGEMCAKM